MNLRFGRPLLAGPARRRAMVAVAGCAILIGVLGAVFAGQSSASRLDHIIDSAIIARLADQHALIGWLVLPGSQVPATVLSIAIAFGCLIAGRLNGVVLALAAVPVAGIVVEVLLKPLVHRTELGSLTYPSGHTTAVTAIAATVTVLLLASPPRPGQPGKLRILLAAAAWLLAGVVAVGLIALRWHYFTDTVAGAAMGIGTVCGLALILDLPAARRWADRAGARRGGRAAAAAGAGPGGVNAAGETARRA